MRCIGNEPLMIAPRHGDAPGDNDRTYDMNRFITLTFLLLGWGFYEASGGAEFTGSADASQSTPIVFAAFEDVPQARLDDVVAAEVGAAAAAPRDPFEVEVVARAHMDFDAPLAPVLSTLPASALVLDAPVDVRMVAGSRVNMRLGPGTAHGVVTVLAGGTRTEVLEENGGWARVRAEDGTTGWMSARLLSAN